MNILRRGIGFTIVILCVLNWLGGCKEPTGTEDDKGTSSSIYENPMIDGEERTVVLEEDIFKGDKVTVKREGNIVFIKNSTTVIHDYRDNPIDIDVQGVKSISTANNLVSFAANTDDIGTIWPSREIPYYISELPVIGVSSGQAETIRRVIKYWENHTTISFKKVPALYFNRRITFMRSFISNKPCHSMTGRKTSIYNTNVYLSNCEFNKVVHEIGHAIGMIHTHQKADRDNYLEVYSKNVSKQYYNDIVPKRTSKEALKHQWGAFDYYSVMHYGCFGKNKIKRFKPLSVPEERCDDLSSELAELPFIGPVTFDNSTIKPFSQGDIDWTAHYYPSDADNIILGKFVINNAKYFTDTTHIEFHIEASSDISSVVEVCITETDPDIPHFPTVYCYDYNSEFKKSLVKDDLYILSNQSYGKRLILAEVKNASGKTVSSNSFEIEYVAELPSITWYADQDGDGYGTSNDSVEATYQPDGYVANHSDADDNNNTIYPGATELCDKLDNDQDGEIDEGVNCTWPEPPNIFNPNELKQFRVRKGSTVTFSEYVWDENCDIQYVKLYKRQMPYPGFVKVGEKEYANDCNTFLAEISYRFPFTNRYQMYLIAVDREGNESEKKYWNGSTYK